MSGTGMNSSEWHYLLSDLAEKWKVEKAMEILKSQLYELEVSEKVYSRVNERNT